MNTHPYFSYNRRRGSKFSLIVRRLAVGTDRSVRRARNQLPGDARTRSWCLAGSDRPASQSTTGMHRPASPSAGGVQTTAIRTARTDSVPLHSFGPLNARAGPSDHCHRSGNAAQSPAAETRREPFALRFPRPRGAAVALPAHTRARLRLRGRRRHGQACRRPSGLGLWVHDEPPRGFSIPTRRLGADCAAHRPDTARLGCLVRQGSTKRRMMSGCFLSGANMSAEAMLCKRPKTSSFSRLTRTGTANHVTPGAVFGDAGGAPFAVGGRRLGYNHPGRRAWLSTTARPTPCVEVRVPRRAGERRRAAAAPPAAVAVSPGLPIEARLCKPAVCVDEGLAARGRSGKPLQFPPTPPSRSAFRSRARTGAGRSGSPPGPPGRLRDGGAFPGAGLSAAGRRGGD